MELKERLKELRRNKGVSAGDLATLTEKAESTVRTWETGKSFPDTDTLSKLADHFGVSVDWLLGRSVYQNNDQATDYEWKFIHSTHKRRIEQIKKRLIEICDKHRADMGQSSLFIEWFMESFDECATSFDKLLTEVKNGHNTGSVNLFSLEIMGIINKLGLDIAWHYNAKLSSKSRDTYEAIPKAPESPISNDDSN